jgi:hypothetical protein
MEKSTPVALVEDRATSSRSIPSCSWRAHWLTAQEFSRVMGRPPATIYRWMREGTLAEFGIPIYQFRQGGLHSGRIFIQNVF